jgi:hypothetical protein
VCAAEARGDGPAGRAPVGKRAATTHGPHACRRINGQVEDDQAVPGKCYRRYYACQILNPHIIQRFRDVGLPLDKSNTVLQTTVWSTAGDIDMKDTITKAMFQ